MANLIELSCELENVSVHPALLLAYMKGNVALCKALVRAGACLAATNKNGVSIFNYQLATKQLLVRCDPISHC